MTFGQAIEALKSRHIVARSGWNGKGMWLLLVTGPPQLDGYSISHLEFAPYIGMKTADRKFVPWLASQTDMLAEDWEVVE